MCPLPRSSFGLFKLHQIAGSVSTQCGRFTQAVVICNMRTHVRYKYDSTHGVDLNSTRAWCNHVYIGQVGK